MNTRCGCCGTTEMPVTTLVIDWRAELLCDNCVASHDWRDWRFDPLVNSYTHR